MSPRLIAVTLAAASLVAAGLAPASLVGCNVQASLGAHDAATLDADRVCIAMPDAGACGQCQLEGCCDALIACQADAFCPCIADCVLTNGETVAACTTHCGGADHGEHAPLITCAQGHCAGSCP